jgi:hypothetical protein
MCGGPRIRGKVQRRNWTPNGSSAKIERHPQSDIRARARTRGGCTGRAQRRQSEGVRQSSDWNVASKTMFRREMGLRYGPRNAEREDGPQNCGDLLTTLINATNGRSLVATVISRAVGQLYYRGSTLDSRLPLDLLRRGRASQVENTASVIVPPLLSKILNSRLE